MQNTASKSERVSRADCDYLFVDAKGEPQKITVQKMSLAQGLSYIDEKAFGALVKAPATRVDGDSRRPSAKQNELLRYSVTR
jgi:hypothetical protein